MDDWDTIAELKFGVYFGLSASLVEGFYINDLHNESVFELVIRLTYPIHTISAELSRGDRTVLNLHTHLFLVKIAEWGQGSILDV